METFYLINQLPAAYSTIDGTKFPIVSMGLLADMQTESRKFLDNVMWSNGSKLTDMLTVADRVPQHGPRHQHLQGAPRLPARRQRTSPRPRCPPDQRAGIITNAGFITARARSDRGGVVPRGRAIKAAFLCLLTPPPPAEIGPAVEAAQGAGEDADGAGAGRGPRRGPTVQELPRLVRFLRPGARLLRQQPSASTGPPTTSACRSTRTRCCRRSWAARRWPARSIPRRGCRRARPSPTAWSPRRATCPSWR